MNRVLNHVHQNYEQAITIDDLAEIAALSPSGLHRMFKRHVGASLSNLLDQPKDRRSLCTSCFDRTSQSGSFRRMSGILRRPTSIDIFCVCDPRHQAPFGRESEVQRRHKTAPIRISRKRTSICTAAFGRCGLIVLKNSTPRNSRQNLGTTSLRFSPQETTFEKVGFSGRMFSKFDRLGPRTEFFNTIRLEADQSPILVNTCIVAISVGEGSICGHSCRPLGTRQ